MLDVIENLGDGRENVESQSSTEVHNQRRGERIELTKTFYHAPFIDSFGCKTHLIFDVTNQVCLRAHYNLYKFYFCSYICLTTSLGLHYKESNDITKETLVNNIYQQ